MYRAFFGLNSKPFSIAPDPRFLYLSERHREALAHLLFGLGEGGGFVQLTGEVGTGKTTLCRALLDQVPEHVDVAFILNPRLNAFELVATACDELGISYPAETTSLKAVIDALNAYLLSRHAEGRRTVLMIDEAQNLAIDVLEQIRLLTNLETTEEKLLQIILIGQPELKQLLARPDLRQLAQRVTARYHLEPLNFQETQAYIRHRLRVCGTADNLFTPAAIKRIHHLTGGIPRLINVLCDRALLGAYVEEKRRIDPAIVNRAAIEVVPEQPDINKPLHRLGWALGFTVLIATVLAAIVFWPDRSPPVAQTGAAALPAIEKNGGATANVAPESFAPNIPGLGAKTEVPVPVGDLPESATPAAPLVTFGDILAGITEDDSRDMWRQLFTLWGKNVPLQSGELACDLAQQQGLRCMSRSGSWQQVLRLNRPVFLELAAPDGRRVNVLMTSVAGDHAEIVTGKQVVEVSLEDLRAVWFGQYSLVWHIPIDKDTLMPGERDTGVMWLRRRMQQYFGQATGPAGDNSRLDTALVQQVKQFQADRNLRQDGVVGAMTFIHLNSLDDTVVTPTLDKG